MPRNPLIMAVFTVALLAACGESQAPASPAGPSAPVWTQCGVLTLENAPALNTVRAWPASDAYGVNSFYIWELDDASTPEESEYYFHSTGDPVTNYLAAEDWEIPPTDWSAIRMNWDGLDPYKFSATDPFYLWYLPYVASTISWQSKTGARNDGTCPASDRLVGTRHRCQGRNQLDEHAPQLGAGKLYLVRMLMIVPLGEGHNRVQSCYQGLLRN